MTEEQREQLKGLCCVEVSGEGCANCISLMPVLHSVISAREDLKLVHVEVNEENKDLISDWEIDRVPTVLLTDDGKIFARCHGFQPEEILELWIDAKMEDHKK
ncbi:MAG: thioredoxin family protein [Clostridia bacterium]|nr:thioredoxin family protein [Clostridia bacterium]